MTAPLIAYHGGVPRLKIGQQILPPSTTRIRSTAEFGAAGVCDPSKVYVTSDVNAAIMFAALHPSLDGQVYKVRTVGTVAHDPDCEMPGVSYTCDAAIIVARVRVKHKKLAQVRKWLLEHERTGR